jgi:hypothetical protein
MFDYHVRVHAALDREHDWSISFNSAEVVHFHHTSRKSSEELWTQPSDAGQPSYHTSKVWLHRDATKPLQRYAEDQQPA